jgi:ATP-binding cassette subfamily F protein 3
LDEPTNYLDIEARAWLETWLQNYSGGYLLVSHDRYFLDVTVNEVYEIFQGDLKRYVGNYTAYEKTRAVEMESLLKRWEAQQEEIEKTEALIRRFRYKASKAAFAQELIKRLEKMERIVIPDTLKKINITLPPPPHAGRIALTMEGISKSYGDHRVLSGIALSIESGEKFLVVGRNGAGKTTLLRILAGEDRAIEGSVTYGTGITAGYFSQDAAETITGSRTVLEYLEEEAPTPLIPRLRDMLGAFLFRGDDVYKNLSVLSGGEKSRLALLRMLLKPMNLLILDEPTNHLDLQSKDILLDCLKVFTGTVIFVSHDRAFMEALSTKTLELAGQGDYGSHRLFYGGFAYYMDLIDRVQPDGAARGSPRAGERAALNNQNGVAPTQTASPDDRPPCGPAYPQEEAAQETVLSNSKEPSAGFLPQTILIKAADKTLSAAEKRAEDKQRQTLVRRLKRQEEEILVEMEQLEAEKNRLETDLGRSEVYTNAEKARSVKLKLDEVSASLEEKTAAWEAKAAELEHAKGV